MRKSGGSLMSLSTLSLEYTPLSVYNLEIHKTYRASSFSVKKDSHDKTVSALLNSLESKSHTNDDYSLLFPSELWGWARSLSASFGRLNKVVLARTVWEVYDFVEPCMLLSASTLITDLARKGNLAFCTSKTETHNVAGKLLLRATDGVLLAHDCEKPFFVEPVPVKAKVPSKLLYHNRHTVYFRFPWYPSIWTNNIHTDEYARTCGFERGLPEFVTYMDWVYYAALRSGWVENSPFSMSLRKVLPMYLDEVIDVVAYENGSLLEVLFLKDGMERVMAEVKKL